MKKVSGQEMVKEDIQELMRRLNVRMEGALRIFGQKRNREHFKEVFFNRFKSFSPQVLADIDEEIYPFVVSYYESVDDLYWYFMSTEDMPSLVETNVVATMKKLNGKYGELIEMFLNVSVSDQSFSEIDASSMDDEEVLLDDEFDSPPPFYEGANFDEEK